MKESGNAAFKAKKWLDAMILYSQSLIAVPLKENEEFASIVVANRSAALYHMNKFEDCLKDVARAFKLGYPKDKSYKLYEREAQSHLGLKNNEPAIAAFK
uniref:Uncharacterized protein n=1 Tax=Megaselia scalaris TaxID=36166 RepID=T1GGT7_MEGSC